MRRILSLLVTIVLVVAACGDSDSGGEDAPTTAPPITATSAPPTTTAVPPTATEPPPTVVPTTTTAPPSTMPPGEAIEIDIEDGDGDGTGIFTAKGPAVDVGIVCAEGTWTMTDVVEDYEKQTSTWKGVYVCDDDSGGFTFDVATKFEIGDTLNHFGEWSVLEGTGAYLGLTGSGTTYVECVDPDNPSCHMDNDGYVEIRN